MECRFVPSLLSLQVPSQSLTTSYLLLLLQDVFYSIRDKTRVIADAHASLAKTVEGSIVQHLQKLRTEIKAHIKNVQNDTGRLAAIVAREREMSTKNISDLARAITMLKNTPMAVVPKDDPYAQNTLVLKQLQKQVSLLPPFSISVSS